MITADQCRAARIFLGLSATDLAKAAAVGIATVKRFEAGLSVSSATADGIEVALRNAGIVFLRENEASRSGGVGVRLATPPPPPRKASS